MISLSVLTGLAIMFCWGIADYFQSLLSRRLGPMKTLFVNNAIGLLLLLPFLAYFQIAHGLAISTQNLMIICLGAAILVISNYFFLKSLEIGEISVVGPITASYSLLTVILAVAFLGEKLSLLHALGVFAIISGVVLTAGDVTKLKHLHAAKGVREAFIAVGGWGIYFFLLGIAAKQMDMMNLFFFTWYIPGILMIVFSLFFKGAEGLKGLHKENSLFVSLAINLLGAAAWIVFNYAIVREQISIVAPISSLYPVILVALGVIIYKERLVLNQKIGIATLLLGLVIISI